MPDEDPIPLLDIDTEQLQAGEDSSPSVARAFSTRTDTELPPPPLSQETSQAERHVRENPISSRGIPDEFDEPPNLTEEEEALLSDVAEETGYFPHTVFEREGGGMAAGGVEGRDVKSPNPTSASGLTSEPSSISQIILYENRPGTGRTLSEELIHDVQNRLGSERVSAIIDSVGGDNEVLQENAEISTEGDYSEQPQEQFAEALLQEMAAVRGQEAPEDSSRAEVLRSMFMEAAGSHSLLRPLGSEQ
jgi:hypothetical protein